MGFNKRQTGKIEVNKRGLKNRTRFELSLLAKWRGSFVLLGKRAEQGRP